MPLELCCEGGERRAGQLVHALGVGLQVKIRLRMVRQALCLLYMAFEVGPGLKSGDRNDTASCCLN